MANEYIITQQLPNSTEPMYAVVTNPTPFEINIRFTADRHEATIFNNESSARRGLKMLRESIDVIQINESKA